MSYGVLVPNTTPDSTYMIELEYRVSLSRLTATAYNASGATVASTWVEDSPIPGDLQILTSDLRGFTLAVGASSSISYDELRFGSERADVIRIPEPAALSLLALAPLALRRARR